MPGEGIAYGVGQAYYPGNARGQIIGDVSGMLKLVFDPTLGEAYKYAAYDGLGNLARAQPAAGQAA